MPTYTFPFSGGVNSTAPYGQRWQIGFGGTWLVDEQWTVEVAATNGNFTLGMGVFDDLQPTICLTYRERVYLGLVSRFLASDNNDPTGFEEQNPGSTFIEYQSQFGSQDQIYAFGQMQGRLAVLASQTIQIWTVDADPSLFNLVQTMDNIGTKAPESVKNLGDYDVLFLDSTGFRSLRSREVTLNAFVEDVGIPIDSLVISDLQSVSPSTCCAVVNPEGKRYWAYLNGKIYVLTRYNNAKISAWSQYLPTRTGDTVIANGGTLIVGHTYHWVPGVNDTLFVSGSTSLTSAGYFVADSTNFVVTSSPSYSGTLTDVTQVTFTPLKFVVYNQKVFSRTSDDELITYGGSDGNTYDTVVPVFEIPWLDDGTPKMRKVSQGIDIGCTGGWLLFAGMTPSSGVNALVKVFEVTSPIGTNAADSSFDLQHVRFDQIGTHFKLQAKGNPTWASPALLSTLLLHYNKGEK